LTRFGASLVFAGWACLVAEGDAELPIRLEPTSASNSATMQAQPANTRLAP